MIDRENVIKAYEDFVNGYECFCTSDDYEYEMHKAVLALLKEQEELLRKLQKDKDKLCLEISGWKHKFHDAPPKFVSQGVVDQICWERDTALSQLEEIGKGLGSKMDDIVALLKEQEEDGHWIVLEYCSNEGIYCSKCMNKIFDRSIKPKKKLSNYCPNCGSKNTHFFNPSTEKIMYSD